ncbi:MAG: UPF0102 protein [Candidatus Tectimicrobiota bacterium]|nr:MAG: UPF0102 protein [Candidatus Tectomicrobia bacterium]
MSTERQRHGQRGEDLAVAYLERSGYRVAARNFRCRGGEVDIVAWDGDTLVFVEVKSKAQTAFDAPQAMVDRRKQARLVQAAVTYLQQQRLPRVAVRFDVVAIWLLPGRAPEITHIPAAFSPPPRFFY